MRLRSLDALRGIAALVVVFHHALMVFPQEATAPNGLSDLRNWLDPLAWLRWSPSRVILAGRPAVILFFILSGLVLTLPFLGPSPMGYWRLSASASFACILRWWSLFCCLRRFAR
jgi:peptidoglycan/LPS O-acetylase OafA/YrhL